MAWFYLFIAGLFEVAWAIGLKYTHGFTRVVPTALTLGSMAISVGLLGLALKTLPVGTAYAVWTGIGSLGAFLVGVYVFGDTASLIRWAGIALVVSGIVCLKMG